MSADARPAGTDSWLAHLPHGESAHYDWLVQTGSLTARLRSQCREFRVQVLAEGLARALRDEAPVLRVRRGERVWVREVLLHCDGRPVVFARSLLPLACRRGPWHVVAGLGARPLGSLLFSDPRIGRQAFRYLRLDARHPLHALAGAHCGARAQLWARRSLFTRAGRAMLVTEVFLPGLSALAQPAVLQPGGEESRLAPSPIHAAAPPCP